MTPENMKASQEAFETDLLSNIHLINEFSLDYGCFFAVTWLSGAHTDGIKAYIQDPQRLDDTAEEKYAVINDWFTAIGYYPFTRAHFIYRAQRTPHVKQFSHHLERALLLYYKGDFFSAVQVLMPAVEGALRSYVGADTTKIGMSLVNLIAQTNRTLALPYFIRRHTVYKTMLERFLREWFFANTSHPGLGTIPSKMNRNYMAHLLGVESFYRPADCNRLFAFFDILLEVITFEEKEAETFIYMPREGIPEVLQRQRYYSEILVPWSPWRQVREHEERFMLENPSYESLPVPDWAGIAAAFGIEDAAAMRNLIAGRQPVVSPLPPKPLKPDQKAEPNATNGTA